MDFIRAITTDQDLVTDDEVNSFLEQLETIDLDQIDEDAWKRIERRVEARDLALYRLIVGQSNMMAAKKFLDLALEGKSVPSTFVKGYLPMLEMIDDIVTAGPGYVQLLKVLHQRAKKRQ